MLAGVIPTEKLAAAIALTIGPGMTGKPGVIQGRYARLPTAKCLGKGDDLKTNPFRVRESEFVLAVESKAIPFIRHTVQAPGAEPIPLSVAHRWGCKVLDFRLRHGRDLRSYSASGFWAACASKSWIRLYTDTVKHRPIAGGVGIYKSGRPKLTRNVGGEGQKRRLC